MIQYLRKENRRKQGFTLMEVMVVVGIIAVISAIAIPSVISMQKNMDYKEHCDYAKTIFLAAQSNLADLRSTGELKDLEDNEANAVLQTNDGLDGTILPDRFTERYTYTFHDVEGNGLNLTNNPAAYYNVVLPENSVESVLWNQQVIIEYNPRTGAVYSVFYAEEYADLVGDYQKGSLQRSEEWLKKNLVGYYDGSDLTGEELGFYDVAAKMSYQDGQEGILTIEVPTQSAKNGVDVFFDDTKYGYYIKGLEIELTVIGENGGMFTRTIKEAGQEMTYTPVSGGGEGGANVLQMEFVLDSLKDGESFAGMAENQKTVTVSKNDRFLTSITSEDFHVAPGDNISLSAEITFVPQENDPLLLFDDAVLAGINPLFHSLTGETGNYTLAVANGRHLQNLNALAPSIASKVSKITFVNEAEKTENGGASAKAPEIDWNETVEYYKNVTNTQENTARNLPYFAPINNAGLYQSEIDGNAAIIRNLKIKPVSNNTYYATGSVDAGNVGLFRSINGMVHDLRIVNPVVRGDNSSQTVGVLAGSAGTDAVVSKCYVYVDTDAEDFSWTNLDLTDAFGGTNTGEAKYGVIGHTAVGGMVGYSGGADFSECFAAVPVYGDMGNARGNTVGVGGFVGAANNGKFNKCYSSVRTLGLGAHSGNKDNSCGLGGFVGTSENAVYTNCFASANVTNTSNSSDDQKACGGFVGVSIDNGTARKGNALYDSCYALGTVRTTNGGANPQAKFVGTDHSASDVKENYEDRYRQLISYPNNGYIYEGCYYLQGYNGVDNDADKCTLPAGYNLLHDLYDIDFVPAYIDDLTVALGKTYLTETEQDKIKGEVSNSNYRKGSWTSGLNSKVNGHHPYMEGYKNNGANYPYSMLTGMPFYGTWPDAPSEAGIGYWELYEDNSFGIYYDRVGENSLKNKTVIADGYLLLSANDPDEIEVTFGNKTFEIAFSGPQSVGGNSYYIGMIPSNAVDSASFYTKVQMNDKIKNYTMYFNPNIAASQINPLGTSQDAKKPGDYIPDEMLIRSPRQLAALGSDKMAAYWDKEYVIAGDIDFTKYGSVADALVGYGISRDALAEYGITPQPMGTIGNSAKAFTGTLGGIEGSSITVTDAKSGLIGELRGGTVVGITLNGSMTLDGAEGALVNTMDSGIMSECTVNAVITSNSDKAGLLVGELNGGTITDCHSTGTNNNLGFVGSAAENDAVTVHKDASHHHNTLIEDGSYTQAQIDAKKFMPLVADKTYTKHSYKATITEDCTFKRNGKTENAVICDSYYYSISGEDKYAASDTSAVAFVKQSGVTLASLGAKEGEWVQTPYYFAILDRYIPVYVNLEISQDSVTVPTEAPETEGAEGETTGSEETVPPETQMVTIHTYTLGYPSGNGSYTTLSSLKAIQESQNPASVTITDMTLYSISLPTKGDYILKNGDQILKADGSKASLPDTGLTPEMIWKAGENGVWSCGGQTVNVALAIPTVGAAQYPTVTVNGAEYRVYEVTLSTDRDVKLVDKDSKYSTTVIQDSVQVDPSESTGSTQETTN